MPQRTSANTTPQSPGYRISWEEYNRTNTRVTHYLPNVTLDYRVTGLTALTTYTIEVAAMTAQGQGSVSASTISSGVPPGGCPIPAPYLCSSLWVQWTMLVGCEPGTGPGWTLHTPQSCLQREKGRTSCLPTDSLHPAFLGRASRGTHQPGSVQHWATISHPAVRAWL